MRPTTSVRVSPDMWYNCALRNFQQQQKTPCREHSHETVDHGSGKNQAGLAALVTGISDVPLSDAVHAPTFQRAARTRPAQSRHLSRALRRYVLLGRRRGCVTSKQRRRRTHRTLADDQRSGVTGASFFDNGRSGGRLLCAEQPRQLGPLRPSLLLLRHFRQALTCSIHVKMFFYVFINVKNMFFFVFLLSYVFCC